jgi:hypothetical protein
MADTLSQDTKEQKAITGKLVKQATRFVNLHCISTTMRRRRPLSGPAAFAALRARGLANFSARWRSQGKLCARTLHSAALMPAQISSARRQTERAATPLTER